MLGTPRNSPEPLEPDPDAPSEQTGSQGSSPSRSADKAWSWKSWAGREEHGGEEYKFGDITRGLFQQTTSVVRDIKHKVADTALSLKEGHEQRAVNFVRDLAKEDDAVKEMAESTVGSSSTTTSGERLWCGLCQDAHTDHRSEFDAALQRKGALGTLEVELQTVGAVPPLLRSDGSKAVKPVCLFSLGLLRTAALRPGDTEGEVISKAIFSISEVADSDLGVFFFDRASIKFQTGSEDAAFCGGCFVPLTSVIEESSKGRFTECLRGQTFEATIGVELLPLEVMRAKQKLVPADVSGSKKPKISHGSALLHFKLSLNEPVINVLFSDNISISSSTSVKALRSGHVGDPFSVLKAAATAVGRMGLALNLEVIPTAVTEFQETPAATCALSLWWSFITLSAPVFLWPLLLALVLPFLTWKVRSVLLRAPTDDHQRLYIDEDGEPNKALVKEALKVSLNIMQLTDNLNKFASQIEKAKIILSLHDLPVSILCGFICLAATLLSSIGLLISIYLLNHGIWRYLLWLPGIYAVLPRAMRTPIYDAAMQLEAWRAQALGDELERRLQGLWARIPDGIEASHRQLCNKYVLRKT